jgi:tRNA(Ile)-lysidine synthase
MILVAVSGGRDSMVLAEKVRRSGGPFAIAHCNFRLRGDESDADEALVREWAARHGITCHVQAFETEAYAVRKGISIEMAARELRYHWFGELCRKHGYEAVLTAHHADDNAETFFLNLLRGTGIKGLCGIQENGFLPDPGFGYIPLLRPVLHTTRAEIDSLAAG